MLSVPTYCSAEPCEALRVAVALPWRSVWPGVPLPQEAVRVLSPLPLAARCHSSRGSESLGLFHVPVRSIVVLAAAGGGAAGEAAASVATSAGSSSPVAAPTTPDEG